MISGIQPQKGWRMPEEKWKSLHEYADQQIPQLAIRWLESDSSQNRETGAKICGQEKVTKAIPRLKKLLSDKASFVETKGSGSIRVYFVRRAAMQALELLGEPVGDITVAEPE